MIPKLEPFEEYASRATSPEPEILRRLREEAYRTREIPQQIAGHLQGRFLAFLTKIVRPRRILEIGTFVGYSALCFAEALPDGGRVITIDRDPTILPIARRYFRKAPYGRRIFLKIGEALEILQSLKGPFDLVYIDADKVNYSCYYDAVFEKIPPGGLIVADNLLWGGSVLDRKSKDPEVRALKRFARKVRSDPRVEAVFKQLFSYTKETAKPSTLISAK
jgi:caffeoyl-CoA O-methyltransferase